MTASPDFIKKPFNRRRLAGPRRPVKEKMFEFHGMFGEKREDFFHAWT
jgi:hypothetical protein